MLNHNQNILVMLDGQIKRPKNLPSFLHCGFGGSNDNLVHGFSHLPASGIRPMLARSIFHPQKLKQLFHFLKICLRSTKLQKPKNNNKLSEFVLIVYSDLGNTCHFSNDVSTLISPQPFIFGMLAIY
jgi:hypothetical protein